MLPTTINGQAMSSKTQSKVTDKRTISPIDHGFAWVVVFASGLTFFLGGGFNRSYTLIYQELLLKFGKSATATAWVNALQIGMKMCSSPFVSALTARFSIRLVAVCGGAIAAASMIMTAFPPCFYYLYLSYGVIHAISSNMIHQSGMVMVGQYFRKRRNVAMGVSTMCVGIGGIFLAPLINLCLVNYGYSGALLIIGGLMFNYIPCGALYRRIPEKFLKIPSVPVIGTKADDTGNDNELNIMHTSQMSITTPGLFSSLENIPSKKLELRKQAVLVQEYRTRSISSCDKKSNIYKVQIADEAVSLPNIRNNKPTTDQLLTDSKAFPHEDSKDLPTKCGQCRCMSIKSCDQIMFCFLMGALFFASGCHIFLSALAQDTIGLSTSQVALLLSISSISDIPIRPLAGAIFDIPSMKPYLQLIFNLLVLLSCGLTFLLPLTDTMYTFGTLWFAVVASGSIVQVIHIGILSDVVGVENLSKAFGLNRFAQGMAIMLGSTVGGLMKDIFGSYSISFFCCGGVGVIVCLVILAQRIYFKVHINRNSS